MVWDFRLTPSPFGMAWIVRLPLWYGVDFKLAPSPMVWSGLSGSPLPNGMVWIVGLTVSQWYGLGIPDVSIDV